jgi:hypothetical protein
VACFVPPRRRFRALVAAHGWRAAAERHFSSTAARLLAAADGSGAGAGGAGSGSAPADVAPVPTPPEWRALYKLLTLVPWAALMPYRRNEVEQLGCVLRLSAAVLAARCKRRLALKTDSAAPPVLDAWLAPAAVAAVPPGACAL